MVCNPPGSSFHGILQARILEWVTIPFSRESSWPREQTLVSCKVGRFFTFRATRELAWIFKPIFQKKNNNNNKKKNHILSSLQLKQVVQFSSVTQSCPTLCDLMNCNTPGLPVHHQLPEFTQTHAHRVGDAIQPSHPLSSSSPPAPNPSQHQGIFQWVSSTHEVAKVLEFQLQHQSFQWTLRTDLL